MSGFDIAEFMQRVSVPESQLDRFEGDEAWDHDNRGGDESSGDGLGLSLAGANRLVSSLTKALAGTPSASALTAPLEGPAVVGGGGAAAPALELAQAGARSQAAAAAAHAPDEQTSPEKEDQGVEEEEEAEGGGAPTEVDGGAAGGRYAEPLTQMPFASQATPWLDSQAGAGSSSPEEEAREAAEPTPAAARVAASGPQERVQHEQEEGPGGADKGVTGSGWIRNLGALIRRTVAVARPAASDPAPAHHPSQAAPAASQPQGQALSPAQTVLVEEEEAGGEEAVNSPEGVAAPKRDLLAGIPATQVVVDTAAWEQLASKHYAAQSFLANMQAGRAAQTSVAGADRALPMPATQASFLVEGTGQGGEVYEGVAAAAADEEQEEDARVEGDAAPAMADTALVPAAELQAGGDAAEESALEEASALEAGGDAAEEAAPEEATTLQAGGDSAEEAAALPGTQAHAEEAAALSTAAFFTQDVYGMATQEGYTGPEGGFAFLACAPPPASADPEADEPAMEDAAAAHGEGQEAGAGQDRARSFMEEITEPDLTAELFEPKPKRSCVAGPASAAQEEEREGAADAEGEVLPAPAAAPEPCAEQPEPVQAGAQQQQPEQYPCQIVRQDLPPHRSRPLVRDSDFQGMMHLHRTIASKPTAITSLPPRPPAPGRRSAAAAAPVTGPKEPAAAAGAEAIEREAGGEAKGPAATVEPAAALEISCGGKPQGSRQIPASMQLQEQQQQEQPMPQAKEQAPAARLRRAPTPAILAARKLVAERRRANQAGTRQRQLPRSQHPTLAENLVLQGSVSPAEPAAAQAAQPAGLASSPGVQPEAQPPLEKPASLANYVDYTSKEHTDALFAAHFPEAAVGHSHGQPQLSSGAEPVAGAGFKPRPSRRKRGAEAAPEAQRPPKQQQRAGPPAPAARLSYLDRMVNKYIKKTNP